MCWRSASSSEDAGSRLEWASNRLGGVQRSGCTSSEVVSSENSKTFAGRVRGLGYWDQPLKYAESNIVRVKLFKTRCRLFFNFLVNFQWPVIERTKHFISLLEGDEKKNRDFGFDLQVQLQSILRFKGKVKPVDIKIKAWEYISDPVRVDSAFVLEDKLSVWHALFHFARDVSGAKGKNCGTVTCQLKK